ncbi:sugar phosphate isomerase/epimerase family protein [Sphingomonas sp. MMS24-JH45]
MPATFFAPPNRPIGLQLYSVAKEAAADLDGTLAAIAAIGYRNVELAGYLGRTPAQLRAALDRAGLRCTSAHVPGKPFRPAAHLGRRSRDPRRGGPHPGVQDRRHAAVHHPNRLPFVFNPGDDVRKVVGAIIAQMTEADWGAMADYMNAKGAALKKLGLNFGFHNHGTEFGPVRGGSASIIELLIARTDPALVGFQLDCGWAMWRRRGSTPRRSSGSTRAASARYT